MVKLRIVSATSCSNPMVEVIDRPGALLKGEFWMLDSGCVASSKLLLFGCVSSMLLERERSYIHVKRRGLNYI